MDLVELVTEDDRSRVDVGSKAARARTVSSTIGTGEIF